ncbi:hypothetical protein SAY86_007014 [Trapa natans]|uniref:Lipoyl-binding domain-containing protein n=1 Tax=Trapa natans TaxID=22666 RepID=A0AAN7LCT1_TRANT|nr:hypothetical protein SAY86_007014 [Trapa natans]
MVPVHCSWSSFRKFEFQGLRVAGDILCSSRRNASITASLKASDAIVTANSSVLADNTAEELNENNALQSTIFPAGFEALLLEVCDETDVSEHKLKIGGFEMHVQQNVVATKAPIFVSPSVPPPIPSEPMDKSGSSTPPPPAPAKTSPFTNISFGKSSRLVPLEAYGSSGCVLVSSHMVGSFRRGRTLKGKNQPPNYKEGDVIKEGQIIGWLDQFGTELPIEPDVPGEVLELLIDDGEPVGFGDPLIAVLPSFPGIN